MAAEVQVCDVRLRLQPQRQLLHFLRSHALEVFLFYIFASSNIVLSQVYDVWEEGAVQDGLQALRERQRIDIETGGGRHAVKVGGCRKQRLGAAGSCLWEVGGRKELCGAKHERRAANCFYLGIVWRGDS